MEKYRLYILILAFMLLATVVAVSALKETSLDVYLSLFAVNYFIASAIFRPRRRFIDVTGISLSLIFCFIVAERVLEILF